MIPYPQHPFFTGAADGNASSADKRYNGTATGNGTSFVADQYLGGVTRALECHSVCTALQHLSGHVLNAVCQL